MSDAPALRVRRIDVFRRPVRFRMPFRFGVACLTDMPLAHLRVEVAFDGGRGAVGVSSCGLPHLWFNKDTSRTADDSVRDQLQSLQIARDCYLEADPATAAGLHRLCASVIRKQCAAAGLNELTSGYGIALLDLAVIDAVCRHRGVPFHQALRTDLLGCGPEIAASIPDAPVARLRVRHTVGLSDAIYEADLVDPLFDGLPESLEAVVRKYGVRIFKVKIAKNVDEAVKRLVAIASLLDRIAGDYQITMDANEQYESMADFADFIKSMQRSELANFWERTLWIEQPVSRHHALDPETRGPLGLITRQKPVIIDESDGTDEAWRQARALGYRGVSTKNCKGVHRTLENFRSIVEWNRQSADRCFMSSEDLSNLPVAALHQDCAVAGALGIDHSERNGHHYIRGLTFLTEREQEAAVREYPSLYERREGLVRLRIRDGVLNLDEVNRAPFGVFSEPPWGALSPVNL